MKQHIEVPMHCQCTEFSPSRCSSRIFEGTQQGILTRQGKEGRAGTTQSPTPSLTPVRLLTAVLLAIASVTYAAQPQVVIQLSTATVRQGRAIALTVRAADPDAEVRVRFAGRSWPVYRQQDLWRTYLGTDPTTPTGPQSVIVETVTPGGSRVLARRTITVSRVSFPRRQLAFDPSQQHLLSDPKFAAEERRKVQAALRVLDPEQLWEGAFVVPVEGSITSPYGVLSIYQGRIRGFHGGVDIAAVEGTPVRAANDGIVRLAGSLPLSGNAVLVDHGLGVVTSYLHLSAVRVTAGQRVRKGDVLGTVGSTGLATGPHLHWGLRTNGVSVDPMPWAIP